jgi:3-phenylpropionate/cinnamic acid dioxygenase small subunit
MPRPSLEAIADRLEIEDLLTRYASALDARDWERFASCFLPDALLDYTSAGGIRGRLPEVRAWLEKVMAGFPAGQHLVVNREIELQGDTARCRSVFLNPMGVPDGSGGTRLFVDGGAYHDRLVRTPDGWRIAERVEETNWTTRKSALLAPAEKKR